MLSTFSCTKSPFVWLIWWNVYSHSLSIFFKLGHLSFYCWAIRFLYIFWNTFLLLDIWFEIFPFCEVSLHFIDGAFWDAKFFNFEEVQFTYFSFSHSWLWGLSKSSLPILPMMHSFMCCSWGCNLGDTQVTLLSSPLHHL